MSLFPFKSTFFKAKSQRKRLTAYHRHADNCRRVHLQRRAEMRVIEMIQDALFEQAIGMAVFLPFCLPLITPIGMPSILGLVAYALLLLAAVYWLTYFRLKDMPLETAADFHRFKARFRVAFVVMKMVPLIGLYWTSYRLPPHLRRFARRYRKRGRALSHWVPALFS